jgi:hypothetical protein
MKRKHPMGRSKTPHPTVAGLRVEALELKLATIAHTVGASRMCVSNYIRGTRMPSSAIKIAFESHYGIAGEDWDISADGPSPAPAPRAPTAPCEPAWDTASELALREHLAAWGIEPDEAEDLSDADCERLDAELRAMLARRGVFPPCATSEVLAAWARDPWPSKTDLPAPKVVPPAPAPAPAAPQRPSEGRPKHPWVRKAMTREVSKHGYEIALAQWQARSGGRPADEFIERE